MPLTGEQLVAARAMVRMARSDLASEFNLPIAAVRRMERTVGPLSDHAETAIALRRALERHGAIFVDAGADEPMGPGVHLRSGMPSTVIALDALDSSNDE